MSFANNLIAWYQLKKRDLPWRKTKDPYFIWLSEIIMQQTRVAQGLPYYERFVELFGNIQLLAEAPEQEVLKAWQGLGYYSRARNLHFTAKNIYEEHQGVFPNNYKDLLKLKGVGVYTAAAIASISYQEPVAVVDGNVYRVLARYFGVYDAPDSTIGKKAFAKLAQEVMNIDYPDIYNQAIMEFGALQCKPGLPDCSICILNDNCIAFLTNSVISLPTKTKKTKVRNRFFIYLVIKTKKGVYMNKRTANDVWKNMYDFPLIEVDSFDHNLLALASASPILSTFDLPAITEVSLEYKHILSHQHIYAKFASVTVLKKPSQEVDKLVFITFEELKKIPVPKLIENFFDIELFRYI